MDRLIILLTSVLCAATANSWASPVSSVEQRTSENARSVTVSVRGIVRDPDGAVVPGATVTLQASDGTIKFVRSGNDGSFTVPSLVAGTYTVTINMDGFSPLVLQQVRVNTSMRPLDVKLRIGEETVSVVVTATENQVSVDPESNASAVTVQGRELDALADDPDELANQLNAMAGSNAGANGGQIYVDGFMTNGQLPPKSAIREVRVNQNPFSAQYDRPGNGRVELLTKAGTDKLHGNLSVEGMDRNFNTATPFLQGGTQPDYHQIFFIGSLTGSFGPKVSYSLGASHRLTQDNSVFSGTVASSGPDSAVICDPGAGTTACSANPLPPDQRAIFTPKTRYDVSARVDIALSKRNALTVRYATSGNDTHSNGVGGLNLASTGNDSGWHTFNVQFSDTHTFNAHLVNEARLDLFRRRSWQTPISSSPSFNVVGSFTGGGSSAGAQSNTLDHFELIDYASLQLHDHFLRVGGRLHSDRVAQYSTANANSSFSYRTISDYLNNDPFQYTVTDYANERVSKRVTDVGIYAEDEWKAKADLTVAYGLRYEAQNLIHSSHDLAPRVSVNYTIPRKKGNPVTTLRVGYGIFYERFGIDQVITSVIQDGINSSQQISRAAGSGVLAGCSPTALALCSAGTTSLATVYARGDQLRSAYQSQFGFTVEQQLLHRTVVSATYILRRGIHQYFSRSLPTDGSGLRYEFQSGGYTRHGQLVLNARSQITSKFSVSGFAQFNHVKSNTNGVTSFQTDSLHPAVDYGAPTYWNRAWTYASGDWRAPFGFTVSPYIFASTGDVYSITTGVDTNADSIINDRAAFAPGAPPNASCLTPANFVAPPIGTVDYVRTPMGYCTGPAGVTVNTRVMRAFGFGPPDKSAGGTGHRYTLSLGAQIYNLFNDVNYSSQNGNLSAVSSGLFGKSQTLQGGTFSSGSAVRRIFLQAAFAF